MPSLQKDASVTKEQQSSLGLIVTSGLHKPHLDFPPSKLTQRHVPFLLGSIQQLHDRVTQLCAEYRALYEQLNIPDVGPRVDWARILDQKMVTAAGFRCISQHLQGQIMPAIAFRALPDIAECGGSNPEKEKDSPPTS